MRRLAFLAPALAALTLMAPPRAGAEPPEPATLSTMADEVQRLQTRIAEGDRSAYPTEMDALKAMAEAISAAKPETWADRREADALVVYVLSGGALRARRSPHQGRQARRVRTRAGARSARLCHQSRGRRARASRPRRSDCARRPACRAHRVRALCAENAERPEGRNCGSRLGAAPRARRPRRRGGAQARDRTARRGA